MKGAAAYGLLAAMAVSMFATPAQALGVLAGTGSIPVPGCSGDPPLSARESPTDAGRFRFDYGLLCATPGLTFAGPWDPAVGGCVPHVLAANPATFCMGPVAAVGSVVTVAIQLCAAPGDCAAGSADVVRLQ